ncbi:MAG: J domain-containing protein [Planctomycetota bacterium]|nr:MAG: J domain-containing protein [Planctomycetota bacterium]
MGGPGFSGATKGFDAEDISSIFEEFFGAGRSGFGGRGAGFHERVQARPQRGRDLRVQTTISFYTAAHGGMESLALERGGAKQTIEVKIPKGIADGATLRIAGKGEPGRNGGPPGDLLLTVRVAPHPLFRRDGLDVVLELPLTIAEATLGATVSVPTPLGERVELKVPPGTSSGAKLRVRGKGLADAKGKQGDLYAVVKIVAPKRLAPEDRQALERLGRTLPTPRTGAGWT